MSSVMVHPFLQYCLTSDQQGTLPHLLETPRLSDERDLRLDGKPRLWHRIERPIGPHDFGSTNQHLLLFRTEKLRFLRTPTP